MKFWVGCPLILFIIFQSTHSQEFLGADFLSSIFGVLIVHALQDKQSFNAGAAKQLGESGPAVQHRLLLKYKDLAIRGALVS